jgi:hypothetical protein
LTSSNNEARAVNGPCTFNFHKTSPSGGELASCVYLISWLLVRSAKCHAKCCAADRDRAGLVFLVRSEATVPAERERVNTQELCNGKILFRRSTRIIADEAKVESGWQEAHPVRSSRVNA